MASKGVQTLKERFLETPCCLLWEANSLEGWKFSWRIAYYTQPCLYHYISYSIYHISHGRFLGEQFGMWKIFMEGLPVPNLPDCNNGDCCWLTEIPINFKAGERTNSHLRTLLNLKVWPPLWCGGHCPLGRKVREVIDQIMAKSILVIWPSPWVSAKKLRHKYMF